MTERYSVLMAVYRKDNAEAFLEAVESMLRQTMPPYEILIVCDGALSDELELALCEVQRRCTCRLQLLRLSEQSGLGAALCAGLEQCSCGIVARMDSDDIAVPERMERQLLYLDLHPEISAVGGQIAEFITAPENTVAVRMVPCSASEVRAFSAKRNPMNHMTVTFRRSAVLAAGSYRAFDRFEDYDLWTRMLGAGARLENLDEVLVYARISPETYERRGGVDYFRQTVRMQKQLRAMGLVDALGYWRNLLVRLFGTVLLPNRLRGVIYRRFLRSAKGGGVVV